LSVPTSIASLALLAAVSLSAGCGGKKEVPCYPVSGQVLVRNQPAAGAVVILHPRSSDERIAKLRPYGVVGADGRFQLNCYTVEDGAPAGEYAVTVVWDSMTPASSESSDPEAAVAVADRLGGRFADPKTTTLSATIKTGENALTPFELQ
jgi:hypothetical protein